MSIVLDAKVNYSVGGAVWIFDTPFSQPPAVCVGIQLSGLAEDIYPLSHKIVELTSVSVKVKVYKTTLTDKSDLVFSECATNDVIVHLTAEGS